MSKKFEIGDEVSIKSLNKSGVIASADSGGLHYSVEVTEKDGKTHRKLIAQGDLKFKESASDDAPTQPQRAARLKRAGS